MSDDITQADATAKAEAEALKKQLEQLQKDLDFQKSESKKAFEKRDELKNKLETIEREKLEKNQEFKELSEKLSAQLEEAKQKLTTTEADARAASERLTLIETKRREKLLADIKDEKAKTFASKITDLTALEEFVELQESSSFVTDEGRGGQAAYSYDNKKWDDIPTKELEELKKKNPDLYNKLYREKFRR